ncbi:MAG: transposase [Crocinitomix sp.]|jgi:transposase
MLFIFEHTGLYSHALALYFTEKNIAFALVSGLEVRRSLGISRGKDDKTDAKKIARYGYRLKEEIEPYRMPSKALIVLKNLLTLRERLVKQNSGFKVTLNEQKRVFDQKENKILFQTQERMIHYLSKQIEAVELETLRIIRSSEQLSEMYDLIITVKGVGRQIALFMIVYTDAFTKFKNARKFASYCGIAPFPNSSGTSLRGKTRVSPLANKRIKSLLEMGARSAIQFSPEMRMFYQKRVEKGKNKSSTLNIVRNKLVARIFAVIERKTPYVDILKYAA